MSKSYKNKNRSHLALIEQNNRDLLFQQDTNVKLKTIKLSNVLIDCNKNNVEIRSN